MFLLAPNDQTITQHLLGWHVQLQIHIPKLEFPKLLRKINKLIDAKGNEFGDEGESYVSPKQGNNLVLSIDMNIQAIVEKYLEEACIDNVCTDGGNVIVMNPRNRRHFSNSNIPIL